MLNIRRIPLKSMVAAAGLATLAACATPPPPPPPPPPPVPTPTPVPSRPTPPNNAAPTMFVPLVDAFGVRQTINAGLSSAQTVWNMRSAMNVAALNCLRPGDEPILTAYTDMLDSYARPLSATNRALDSEFRQKYGATYRTVRDQYMTQVYNYFALPPVLPDFCDAALQVAQAYLIAKPEDFDVYAANTLPRLERQFLSFFGEYEQWRSEVAAWDARYGAEYGHIYPAYLEAHSAPVTNVEIAGQPTPATGALVIDVPAQAESGAVVQPLPSATTSTVGPVAPQVQLRIDPDPQPQLSIPQERAAEPQFVSEPVVEGSAQLATEEQTQPILSLPIESVAEQPASVGQPVVQTVDAEAGDGE